MVDYAQLMLKKFASEFNEDVDCFFRQGYVDNSINYEVGPSYINMLTDNIVTKPNGKVFMYVNVIEGITNNGSIGSDVLQEDPFTMQFRVYTPNGSSFKESKEIESKLDLIFKRKDFVFGDACINSDTVSPKDKSMNLAEAEDGFHVLSINYRYLCRYFD